MGNPNLSKVLTATIANGASLSDIQTVFPVSVTAIVMPAAWTTAHLTFQGSFDGVNFFDLYNDAGVEYDLPILVSQAMQLNVPLTFPYLKVRSGTTGSAVNQGASRAITLICG